MKRLRTLLLAALAGLAACAETQDRVTYRPSPQILPPHIKRLAILPIKSQTGQFGLEDKFALRLRDEFLRDGKYAVVPAADADGAIKVFITRYILTPTQYDAVLTPVAYKLQVVCNVEFVDQTTNVRLWEEKNMGAVHLFGALTVRGGKTEEQAREFIWDLLSRDIAKRVIEGFGSVTGSSLREISPKKPANEKDPVLPPRPVNPNPY